MDEDPRLTRAIELLFRQFCILEKINLGVKPTAKELRDVLEDVYTFIGNSVEAPTEG
jgi:hypothetical protein